MESGAKACSKKDAGIGGETSRPEEKAKTRLSPNNYDFQLIGTQRTGDRTTYEIEVTPKRQDKYLFQGRIWVDSDDYALVRADE